MVEIGYALSSEEHSAPKLVEYAEEAEKIGFSFAMLSDHFHPWTNHQGQSPFAWSVLGAIAQVTKKIKIGTGVTCPILRYHPAIIAQATATIASMMEGRFMLGLGTGENLNEHIIGGGWPPIEIRQEMLVESLEIMDLLWEGETSTYYGEYYTVEDARIYSLPKARPVVLVAASGKVSAMIAGKMADGLISTSPDKKTVQIFEEAGGKGKPKYGQVTVCYSKNEQEARKTAFHYWPTAALHGQLSQELRTPAYFEQVSKNITEENVAQNIICNPDPEKHIQAIQQFIDSGFDHIYIHQVGPDQKSFFDFYEQEILPSVSSVKIRNKN